MSENKKLLTGTPRMKERGFANISVYIENEAVAEIRELCGGWGVGTWIADIAKRELRRLAKKKKKSTVSQS